MPSFWLSISVITGQTILPRFVTILPKNSMYISRLSPRYWLNIVILPH